MRCLLGVNIGGTKTAVVLGRVAGDGMEIIDKASFPTGKGPEPTIEKMLASIDELLAKHHAEVESAGIICGGPLDSKKGIIRSPPNLVGWDDVPIVKVIEERLGVRAWLENDANACAVAEWRYGAARGCSNAVFLTFGTGMGAGLIVNGRLHSGASDMAGEVGHIRLSDNGPVGYGKAGSFEGFCSGGGIAQLARTKALEALQMGGKVGFCPSMDALPSITAKTVAEAATKGDKLAIEVYRTSGEYLGWGLSILIDILNPEVIVIGGIFTRSRDLLWPAAETVINRECLGYSRGACRVVPSSLGESIEDVASLTVAAGE
jgi:glucokinase